MGVFLSSLSYVVALGGPFAGSAVEVAASHGCGFGGEWVAVAAGDAAGVAPFASGDNASDGEFGVFVGFEVGLALGEGWGVVADVCEPVACMLGWVGG